jgi:heme A synthase
MRFHHLAALTALLTFALMILGSLVHGTGSSLACPDWPLCHGTVFPRMTGGVELEHTHRLVALSVATLTAVLFFRARRFARARVRRIATAALLLVIVQASLGAATVLLRLPPAVSIAHLATSMGVLSTLVLLAVETTLEPERAHVLPRYLHGSLGTRPVAEEAHGARAWVAAAAVAALAQATLGALVRHSGAALACASVPLCDGAAWPDAPLPRVQMAHRMGAVVVTALVVLATARARALSPPGSTLGRVALVAAGIVLLQGALGVAVVVSYAPLAVVTVHHATGAMLLAVLVGIWGALRSQRVEELPAMVPPCAPAGSSSPPSLSSP